MLISVAHYALTQISAIGNNMSKIIIDSMMDEESMLELAGNRSMEEIESVKDFLLMSIRHISHAY